MFLLNKYDQKIHIITEFRIDIQKYIILEIKEYPSDSEAKKILSLRETLNTLAGEVKNYVEKAGVSSGFYIGQTYTPAFSNLFNISINNLQAVIDLLDQAIGNYKYLRKEFKRKCFNPLYWIGEFIRIPFCLASFAGFDVNKIEFSIFGKIYKFLFSIAIFLAAICGILTYFKIFFGLVIM